MTVAISDIIVPPEKKEILAATEKVVNRVERDYNRGLITEDERYKKVVKLWSDATDDVADAMMANMDTFNNIFMMLTPVPAVTDSRCVSSLVCVVLWLIHLVKSSTYQSKQTSVKA